jgi:hypothetical protein
MCSEGCKHSRAEPDQGICTPLLVHMRYTAGPPGDKRALGPTPGRQPLPAPPTEHQPRDRQQGQTFKQKLLFHFLTGHAWGRVDGLHPGRRRTLPRAAYAGLYVAYAGLYVAYAGLYVAYARLYVAYAGLCICHPGMSEVSNGRCSAHNVATEQALLQRKRCRCNASTQNGIELLGSN